MAMAFTAWLRAPAPTTWTSTAPVCRTTPAIAPATEFGLLRLDTLRISTGPPGGRDVRVSPRKFDRMADPSCGRSVRFFAFVSRTLRVQKRAACWSSVERDRLVVRVGAVLGLFFGLGLRDQASLLADAAVDFDHHLEVLGKEGLGVLPPLSELLALVGEPGPGLLHQPEVDPHIDEGALTADALAVRDVELRLAEGRCALVLDHLHTGAVADDLDAVLDRLDAPDVEPDR